MGSVLALPYPHPPSQMLTLPQYIKHYSVLPTVAIMVYDMALVSFFTLHAMSTKDHVIDRSKKPLNERMDLLHPYHLKLMVIEEQLRPGLELLVAYRKMNLAAEAEEEEIKKCRRDFSKKK